MNEKKDTGRNANIDLIRTLCTLFVIMIHTTVKPLEGNRWHIILCWGDCWSPTGSFI